jgi:hypothetical protein
MAFLLWHIMKCNNNTRLAGRLPSRLLQNTVAANSVTAIQVPFVSAIEVPVEYLEDYLKGNHHARTG